MKKLILIAALFVNGAIAQGTVTYYYPGRVPFGNTNPAAVGPLPDGEATSLSFGGQITFYNYIPNIPGIDFWIHFNSIHRYTLFFLDRPEGRASVVLSPASLRPSIQDGNIYGFDISDARSYTDGAELKLGYITYLSIYASNGQTSVDAIQVVPEPDVWALGFLGLGAVVFYRKYLTRADR